MLTIKDCGLMLEPQLGMQMSVLVDTAKLVEKLGFGYLFRSDHFLPADKRRGVDAPECWTSLGVIAASTASLKFGPMVTPIGFRNPALLARMACTLHSFSGGRLRLSLGAGWHEAEYIAHGYAFPSFGVRRRQFEEGFSIIRSLVRDGRADFDGKYFSAHTDCYPRPAGKMHIIVGAKAKSLVTLAGRYADEWNLFTAPPGTYDESREAFRSASEGREVLVSQMGPFLIGKSEDDLVAASGRLVQKLGRTESPKDFLARWRKMNVPCGTEEEFAEQVGRQHDAGIKRFYFQTFTPEDAGGIRQLAQTLKDRL